MKHDDRTLLARLQIPNDPIPGVEHSVSSGKLDVAGGDWNIKHDAVGEKTVLELTFVGRGKETRSRSTLRTACYNFKASAPNTMASTDLDARWEIGSHAATPRKSHQPPGAANE